MTLDRILAVHHLAQRMTDPRAVLDRDTLLRIARHAVDEQPQHGAASGLRELQLDQLVAHGLDRRLQQAQ